jgi:intron-binding protein aquarius
MEEASQCLDIETLVPITLAYTQLKRIILLGDNIQLPPIVKHESFRTYADMNRSLFNRFIDLNFISCTLQDQGRSRPTIVQLYQHQYPHLANLPLVKPLPSNPFYYFSNPGFQYDYQFIDVQDYNGKGETSPNPYFYQNLGEAEYAVALFMYMRMQGYPANKITILTTYNGIILLAQGTSF